MDFNLNELTNEELKEQLYKEFMYECNLYDLAGIIVKVLPRKYTMRIISKLYRLRKQL